ncbi:phosphotransferase enzyme family protein [Frankia sp. Cj3]|uniref:phosphotransferase enzyme family protein n=2 Tax=Frankia TaxID=1854 RepID=UPI001EF70C10|nr:aminoglycoside phosphotransferase family protein [Frankia sp. Cj3]
MAWKESDARMAAFDAFARLGVGTPPELDLLRFGENALYAYRDRGLVLRVARPESRVEQVARTVEFVVRLAARGMEVAEPAAVSGVGQPVVTSTDVVILWVYYEIDAGCRVTPRELGGLLRHFHDCAAPDGDRVGPWEPFALLRPRLDGARRDGIEQSLIDPLEALLASLESHVPDVVSTLGTGVIHGDMHYGNVMCLPGRRLLLIDFDQISAGPLEWDLVPNLVTYRRFGMSDEDYASFSAAYGYDLRASPHAGTFIALRELGMVTWLLQQYGTSASLDAEIHRRIDSINDPGSRATAWRAY